MMRALLILVVMAGPVWAGPEIHRWETQNGVDVWFIESPELPMVDIEVVFDAGAARDGDLPGLAGLTAAMLSEGAGDWSAQEIAEAFDSVGAEFGAGSARDMHWYTLRSLSEAQYLDRAVDVFRRVLQQPTFPAEAFERLRKQALTGLKAQQQSAAERADLAFMAALYPDHPYGQPEAGTEASLAAMTVADIQAFYGRYLVARNADLVMIGALTVSQAKDLARSLVADLPKGQRAPALPPVPAQQSGSEVFVEHPSTQSHILIGLPAVARGDERFWPLYVGNQLLGGNGLVSLLSQEVREKRGLAYSASSYFAQMAQPGPFIMSVQTRTEKRDEAIQVMRETLSRFMSEPMSGTQLAEAQDNLIHGFPMRIDNNRKKLGYLAMMAFYDLPENYLDTWQERVRAVTAEGIKAAFSEVVEQERLFTVVVGEAPP